MGVCGDGMQKSPKMKGYSIAIARHYAPCTEGNLMVRPGRRAFSIMSYFTDILIAPISMAIAFWLRFCLFSGENPIGTMTEHVLWVTAFSPLYVFFYGLLGVYDRHRTVETSHKLGQLVAANTITTMLFIDCIFVLRVIDFSRWLVVFYWIISVTLSCLKELAVTHILKSIHRSGRDLRRVVIVGSGAGACTFAHGIAAHPSTGQVVVGNIGEASIEDIRLLGSYADIDHILDTTLPDEVVIAIDAKEQDLLDPILIACKRSGIKLSILPAYYQFLSSRPSISIEGGVPLINVQRVVLDNLGFAFLKRLMDVVGSAVLIVLTSPIMLVAVIGTKLSSPGPVLFKQERVGRNRKPFYMYKFRSMRVNVHEADGWTVAGDPRRTAFGAFMRRYSIDELPQLFNVLRGDMSLVGPRPELPQHVYDFKGSVPLYMLRHQVRPGMTGWAQINGLRGDTSIEARVEYDLYYIENWSFMFDLRILFTTPFKGIVNKQEPLVKKSAKK